jgi:putative ABC transport system permease protein
VRGNVQAKHGNKNTRPSLLGTTPTYFAVREFKVQRGRILSDADCDSSARVAVIGPTTAKNLFGDDFLNCIGQSIEVNGVHYAVIGILKAKGDQGWFNPDDQIIIPYTTAMAQVLGVDYLGEVDLSARDPLQLSTVQTRVTLLLRKRHRLADDADNDFNVRNQADVLSSASTINTILSLLLGGIAGISLLVGGIGVMNVMLVTVAERTREIGVRKAIGARKRDVLLQFTLEAITLTAIGGILGVLLGAIITYAIRMIWDSLPATMSVFWAAFGFFAAAAEGLVFGIYPAWKAANLDPIESLRYE